MLGYSKWEWGLAGVVGVVAFSYILTRDDEPEAAKPERASAAEIAECEQRIKRSVAGQAEVDVHTLTGSSSDKLGAGGTSRVKLYFDQIAPGGVKIEYQGFCQFAEGMPELLVTRR